MNRLSGQDSFAEPAKQPAEFRDELRDRNQPVEPSDRLSDICVVAGDCHQSQYRCLPRFSSGVTGYSTSVLRPVRGSEHQVPHLSLDMA